MKNDLWYLEGMRIKALYLGSIPCSGIVKLSRVQYGGTVSHHIDLDKPINVYGTTRDRAIIEAHEVLEISEGFK